MVSLAFADSSGAPLSSSTQLAENQLYLMHGAHPNLAAAMASHFRLLHYNPRDTSENLERKLLWAPAFADDLALRMLLKGDIIEASRLFRLAAAQTPSTFEPNEDRSLILQNIEKAQIVLGASFEELGEYRRTNGLPSLNSYTY